MKTVKLILGIVTIGMMVASCNKEVQEEVNPTNSSTPGTNTGTNTGSPTGTSTISYTSLSAEQSTIAIGATTKVTATATGNGLSYIWSASNGDLIGSGSQITYGASGCCGGTNTVTCTIKDSGNHQESKSVSIVVQ